MTLPVVVPYSGAIPGGVRQGLEIEVQGIVPHHAHQGFSVNLCQGPQLEPTTTLHVNARLSENTIVLNHMQNNGWGGEERKSGHQFQRGKPFDLRIIVKPQMFKLKLNGNHVADFAHRLPKETAQFVVIKGEVSISYIKFSAGGGGGHAPFAPTWTDPYPGQPYPPPAGFAPPSQPGYPPAGYPPQPSYPTGVVPPPAGAAFGAQPIYNPPVPFVSPIPGGLYPGRMISMSAIPHPHISRFTVNLQAGTFEGSDVALHFDVRFHYGDDRHVIVRNHCQGGQWGQEERHVSHFPFKPNHNCDILILVEPASFKVAVNNQHLVEFRHRLPLQSANTLSVSGDVRLTQVRFQ
nr:hypothetical protein BaRGS_029100 [Batillaria attramentaria]